MLEFVKHNGLPYLVSPDGEFFAVRWDAAGFTPGGKVALPIKREEVEIFSELSIKAQCGEQLDSISAQGADKVVTPPADGGTDFDSMTVKELRAYAEANGIDLDGKTKKSDIVEAVKAVLSE